MKNLLSALQSTVTSPSAIELDNLKTRIGKFIVNVEEEERDLAIEFIESNRWEMPTCMEPSYLLNQLREES
jgi:hypothetical protein